MTKIKIGSRQNLAPSLPSRNKTAAIAAKSYEEVDIKVFGPVQFWLISLLCPIKLFWDCMLVQNKGVFRIQHLRWGSFVKIVDGFYLLFS